MCVGTACKPMNRATLVTLHCSIHNGGESPSGEMFRVFSGGHSVDFLTKKDFFKINVILRRSLNDSVHQNTITPRQGGKGELYY